jgi:hypothetical protein
MAGIAGRHIQHKERSANEMSIQTATFHDVKVGFADSPAVDSFGRLRVSTSTTLFDSQQEYGLDTLRLWDASANGTAHTASSNGSAVSGSNAVGPRNANTRMVPITVVATSFSGTSNTTVLMNWHEQVV